MKAISFCFLFLFCFQLKAQEFAYSSEFPKIDSTGFYKIQLSPEIVGLLNENGSNMRVFSDKHEETGFVIVKDSCFYLIPSPKIRAMNTGNRRRSRFELQFSHPFAIHHLQIQTDRPFYYRKASLTIPSATHKVRLLKRKQTSDEMPVAEFELSSDKLSRIELSETSDLFFLDIRNEDAPPFLSITCKAWGQNLSIVAFLKSNTKYDLYISDKELNTPIYDISQLNADTLKTKPLNLKNLKTLSKIEKHKKVEWPEVTVWISLFFLIIGMSWMSLKMLKKSK